VTPRIPAAVQAATEASMLSTCVITEAGTSTFTAGTGISTTDGAEVYAGACSLLAPRGNRSSAGGDDRQVEGQILRLPLSATGVAPGQLVVVDGGVELVVAEILNASIRSQRRVRVVSSIDAPGVPA